MQKLTKKQWIILSPLIMVGLCHVTAKISSSLIGKWAFIPVMLCLWIVSIFFIKLSKEDQIKEKWLKSVKGKYLWKLLIIIVGLLPLPVFLMHWELLKSIEIFIPYLLIAFLNPFIEEFYWRGVLIDNLSDTSNWVAILYSSFFFALNHPASFGMFSNSNSGYIVFASTFIMGIIWGIGYKKTGSLRVVIFSHFLVDVFNLSVPAFLDLFQANF